MCKLNSILLAIICSYVLKIYDSHSFKFLGIVSWGYGCGRPNRPGVYTKISGYRKWLDERMFEWRKNYVQSVKHIVNKLLFSLVQS